MKRKLVFLALILALVALPITACAQEAPAPAPAPKPEPIVLTAVQSGPVGGPQFWPWEWSDGSGEAMRIIWAEVQTKPLVLDSVQTLLCSLAAGFFH